MRGKLISTHIAMEVRTQERSRVLRLGAGLPPPLQRLRLGLRPRVRMSQTLRFRVRELQRRERAAVPRLRRVGEPSPCPCRPTAPSPLAWPYAARSASIWRCVKARHEGRRPLTCRAADAPLRRVHRSTRPAVGLRRPPIPRPTEVARRGRNWSAEPRPAKKAPTSGMQRCTNPAEAEDVRTKVCSSPDTSAGVPATPRQALRTATPRRHAAPAP